MNTKNIKNKKVLNRRGVPLMGIIPWCISVCIHEFDHCVNTQNTKTKKALDRWGAPLMGIIPKCIWGCYGQ